LIENKEKKNVKSTDYVKIHETEKNNFSLICTVRRCKLLLDALPTQPTIIKLKYNDSNNEFFHFTVSKSLFSFEKQSSANNFIINDKIKDLCKTISSIKISMKDLITDVFNKFITSFHLFREKMESIIHFITIIDVLYNKASISKKYNYCKPSIISSDKSFVNAKGLRHCLIERFQSNELYTTNDIFLGVNNIDGILLYGTNAVGKTSFIKALGISVIMAQSGLFVPCSTFHYFPYNYLFTRIIGNDNIFKGLSTFAVEMSELRSILRLSDQNSLILGDELCSGTEIMSAISIFVAGIQQLYRSKSSFIFATHLHEIVNYDEITKLNTVVLKHMEVIYDKQSDTLIYDRKLKDGPGNSMYGLEVCKSLHLPDEFIKSAYEIRTKYYAENQNILSLKTSQYNAKKIINVCELCQKNPGKEVHHLQYQKDANCDGIIITEDNVFHKNHLANLVTLCDKCHTETHKKNTRMKRVKTSQGTKIVEV
jgi:DNA mismatch repair protein MutS